ncbi:unnamed protein product [Rodentolepis nana]|uniref:DUF4210 domain-containing protein n=1 Tax=Rodentolepis nana TaxID=102285 RepID=A0A158QGS1_RODNA|nr:unnamed protein product [Rodentolepis nana]
MDPHLLQIRAMIVDHDHPYCQPSYLDPISTCCIEPKVKNEPDSTAIDIIGDENDSLTKSNSPSSEDSRLFDFCRSDPIPEADDMEASITFPSTSVVWNLTVNKPLRKLRKFLKIVNYEDSIHSQKSGHIFDEFRRHSRNELVTKRIARNIRNTFADFNWRIDSCAELHERLLNTLPTDLLFYYLRGYVILMGKTRITALMRRLNKQVTSNRKVIRFDYSSFLDYVLTLPPDGLGYRPARRTSENMECDNESSRDSYSPITFIPSDVIFPPNVTNPRPIVSGRSSSLTDRAAFICVLPKNAIKSSRLKILLRSLSKLGHLVSMTMAVDDNPAFHVRRIGKSFRSLLNDSRSMPIYLIGFGATCSAVLCAATDETCVRSSEDIRLHDIICGRSKTDEVSAPTRPWLAALILIAPPQDAFLPENIPHFEQIPTHFSLLVVVGARFRKEANTFRETFIRTRQQTALGHNTTATPFVSDLRMLIIGGADSLLRMHPATLERFATTQAAIDQAIVAAVKNLTLVCQNLVKTISIPVQAELMTASGLDSNTSGGVSSIRNGSGLPTVFLTGPNSNRRPHQSQTAALEGMLPRRGRALESSQYSRRASILRGGMQQRSTAGLSGYVDRFSSTYQRRGNPPVISRQSPHMIPRDRTPYGPQSVGGNSMIRFTNGGNRVRFSGAQPMQRPSVYPATYGGRVPSRFNGGEVPSGLSPQLRPPSLANNPRNAGSSGNDDSSQFLFDRFRALVWFNYFAGHIFINIDFSAKVGAITTFHFNKRRGWNMNITKTIPTLIDSDISFSDPEIDKAAEIFASICELIFRRGQVARSPTLSGCSTPCIGFTISTEFKDSSEKPEEASLHIELKRIGYTGNPIIIEFLLLPTAEIGDYGWSSVGKHIPAYLVEQWMIQFLPKRLVTEDISDISTLFDDIKSYCDTSLVNKLLFKSEKTFDSPCCVCRLTNIWGANLFSSCWFILNTTDLSFEIPKIGNTHFGFKLIRDLSDNFANSEGVHTTTRTKCPRRNYLCNNPCSHIHRKDTAGICVSKSLSRILAGTREVLDTMVTSVVEMPIIPPSDNLFDSLRYLHNGAMSLPSKRCNDALLSNIYVNTSCDDAIKYNKVPKSPFVIMSQWLQSAPSTSSSFSESTPCKLKRLQQFTGQQPQVKSGQNQGTKPQVEECITQFTSLSVQQKYRSANKAFTAHLPDSVADATPNADISEKCHFPLIRKAKYSNSFTEVFSSHSASFNKKTGLPLQSSPVPGKQKNSTSFDFDPSLVNPCGANGNGTTSSFKTLRPTTLALKRRPSSKRGRTFSASATFGGGNSGGGISFPGTPLPPPSFSQLLINFEFIARFTGFQRESSDVATGACSLMRDPGERLFLFSVSLVIKQIPLSDIQCLLTDCVVVVVGRVDDSCLGFNVESMLNGRIAPAGMVDGFSVSLGASGSFFPTHAKLPVVAYFFHLDDDGTTPSPYLGHVDLTKLSNKRGYRVPNQGSIQVS